MSLAIGIGVGVCFGGAVRGPQRISLLGKGTALPALGRPTVANSAQSISLSGKGIAVTDPGRPAVANTDYVFSTFTTSQLAQSHAICVVAGKGYWIDWGDGTAIQTGVGNDGFQAITHNYASAGTYVQRWAVEQAQYLYRASHSGNALTGSLPSMTRLVTAIDYYGQANGLSGAIPCLTSCSILSTYQVNNNALTSYTPGTLAATIIAFHAFVNSFTQAAVDAILADFATGVAGRPAAGIIDLSGAGNAAPSAAGLASKAAILAAKPGWTVTTN